MHIYIYLNLAEILQFLFFFPFPMVLSPDNILNQLLPIDRQLEPQSQPLGGPPAEKHPLHENFKEIELAAIIVNAVTQIHIDKIYLFLSYVDMSF